MLRISLAELRGSWPAWLGVSLALVVTNLSFATSALVQASGWAAVRAGRLELEASGEFTLVPISNHVLSGLVGLVVIGTAAGLVVDARRGALARLGLAGATPGQVVRSVLAQLVLVCLACAVVADLVAVLTLEAWLGFLTTGVDSGESFTRPDPVYSLGAVALANLGVLAVAVLGGLRQARRAAALAPVEALRESAAPAPPRMTGWRWAGVAVAGLALAGPFAAIGPLAAARDKETVSTMLQLALLVLVLVLLVAALLAPLVIGPSPAPGPP